MHISRAATALLASATLLVAGCSSADPLDSDAAGGGSSGETVSLGTANFPESEIIGQIWAEALRQAGYNVEIKSGIGSREVYLKALEEGTIDIVPEYAGNLTQYYGELEQGAGADDVRATLTEVLPDDLEAGEFSPAESKDAYRVTRATADQFDLKTIADLDKLDAITVAAPPEFAERPYGPKGLTDVYGIDAGKITVSPISDGGGPLTVAALVEGAANTANIFTTSPALLSDGSEADLVTLEDPQLLIPPQNVVPVVRAGALPDGALDAVNSINATLTTQDLVAMNLRNVGEEHAEPAVIAQDWMENK
ncbi:ABC transporter substrate-binding protein [Corynebacterium lujinxingii]|uniref:ABC transporter substrate-binding protein n=1 Tax=Corynebacterium lujinxingii TaxID=2763010 RepID=A0A7H0K0V7_9CORY|nr:ABC transporter substrate-binding protein [Corynebacterium lujinxingii]MBC3179769.1 ABC transporter substrate-binding protein [Corynebacterium lujinxingii]NNO10693.1 ABC transporter substrate-binding protein [Corynebacterium lujinxingii]QNP90923.1 ABC transporter substrate-binding protein [Corynebacterium lujinxingii]